MNKAEVKKVNPYYQDKDTAEAFPYCISCVGWEGDQFAVLVYLSGSFWARGGDLVCRFGISEGMEKPVTWTMANGYLPCLTSTFRRGNMEISISHFCDRVIFAGAPFSVLYTRVIRYNTGVADVTLPVAPSLGAPDYVRLTPQQDLVPAGATIVEDFVLAADRFANNGAAWPAAQSLADAGGFDAHLPP